MSEMVRVVDHQEIKLKSVSVANGVSIDASWDQFVVWGVSDQYSEEAKGYAVYSGSFDLKSGEPVINW